MDRERLDNWCEKVILGLVLAVLVIGPLALGGSHDIGFLILQGLTLGVVAMWALRLWVNPKPKLLWPPICWAVLAFVVYAIVRYCQADIEFVARKELIRVLVYAFLFYAVLNNLHRQESTQIISFTLVYLAMAISVYAVVQYMTKSQRIGWVENPFYPGRAGGTFIYPNQFAGFLEMLIPLALCMVLMGRISHVSKIVMGYAVVVMLAGVAVTFSRGGWLVTGMSLVAVSVFLLFQRDFWLKALVLLAVLLVAGIFLIPKAEQLQDRARRAAPDRAQSNVDDVRYSVWWSTIQMWQEHKWWGVGPGHFDQRYNEYRLPAVKPRAGYAHNDYLNTLADWGAAGLALIALTLGLLYWGIFKCWRFVRGTRDDFSRKNSTKLAFLTGASAGLAAILTHSLVDFTLQLPANAILAVTLMALLTSQWRFATDRYWVSAGMVMKCATTIILAAGLSWLGYAEWRNGRELVLLHQASKAPAFTFARIAALEKAWALDTNNFNTTFAIAEIYKTKSFLGESDDPSEYARKAMTWYERGMKSNPYESDNWLRYGMCLDWIGPDDKGVRPDSGRYYERANELDPNGYFTTANTGWHYVQIGDYAAARTWFERSKRLEWGKANDIGPEYLLIVERRLMEATTDLLSGNKPVPTPEETKKP